MDNTSSNQKERWSTFSFFHFIILSHHGKLFQKGRKEKEAKEIFLGINKRNKFILRGEKLDALPTFRQSQTSTISIVIDEILQGKLPAFKSLHAFLFFSVRSRTLSHLLLMLV